MRGVGGNGRGVGGKEWCPVHAEGSCGGFPMVLCLGARGQHMGRCVCVGIGVCVVHSLCVCTACWLPAWWHPSGPIKDRAPSSTLCHLLAALLLPSSTPMCVGAPHPLAAIRTSSLHLPCSFPFGFLSDRLYCQVRRIFRQPGDPNTLYTCTRVVRHPGEPHPIQPALPSPAASSHHPLGPRRRGSHCPSIS
jgi:hypothetical protein